MDTDSLLQNLAQPALEQAMNLNLAAYWIGIGGHLPDTEMHWDEAIAWTSSSMDISYFNIIVPLRLRPGEQDAAIAASIERARGHEVETMWWVSPALLEVGLGERLEAQGFADVGGPAGMAIDLANLNEDIPHPVNFEIKRVNDQTLLEACADTLIDGWPLPEILREPFIKGLSGYGFESDLRHYIGYVDGTPATVSSVRYNAGVAGIYAVATRSEFRGKGLGALVTQAPLLEAREAGYKVGILQASGLGHPVYKRLGFEDIFAYKIFLWPVPKEG